MGFVKYDWHTLRYYKGKEILRANLTYLLSWLGTLTVLPVVFCRTRYLSWNTKVQGCFLFCTPLWCVLPSCIKEAVKSLWILFCMVWKLSFFCFFLFQHHVCALIPQAPHGTVVCFNRCCLWSPRWRALSSTTVTQGTTWPNTFLPESISTHYIKHIKQRALKSTQLWQGGEKILLLCSKGNCDTLCCHFGFSLNF